MVDQQGSDRAADNCPEWITDEHHRHCGTALFAMGSALPQVGQSPPEVLQSQTGQKTQGSESAE